MANETKNLNDRFNINNFVINYIVRGVMINPSNNDIMWSINQIEDPSLSVTSETSSAVDALGSIISSFSRAKTAEFTANQCIFDLSLFAAQSGTSKNIASDSNIVTIPTFETLVVPTSYMYLVDDDDNYLITDDGSFLTDGTLDTITSVKLKNNPIHIPNIIYKLNDDDSLGEGIFYSAELSEGKFTYSNGSILFLNSDINNNDRFFIIYEYESNSSISVANTAINTPKAGRFILEILGCDICNPSELIYAYLIFPNAVLDANVDLSFTTEGRHPFTIFCRQNMCEKDKVLFQLIIPE